MPYKTILCLFALLFFSAAAHSVITEDSASANALSGITILSTSVSDFTLSPTIPATGVAFSYHFPFSLDEAGVYSLNTASAFAPFIVHGGASFLGHEDYRWQDFRVGLALHIDELSLGYTQHFIYEKISTDDSYSTWTGDIALSFRGMEYGTEVKLLHAGAEDTELHLTASSIFVPGIMGASTYVYAPHGEDSYRFATSFDVAELFELQTSWQSETPRFGAGIKFRILGGELMYAIRTHTELSLSHSLDIGFNW